MFMAKPNKQPSRHLSADTPNVGVERLSKDLRSSWRGSTSPHKRPGADHYDRARQHLLVRAEKRPNTPEADPVTLRAASRYLEVRSDLTTDDAKRNGFNTVGGYAGHLVVSELVQPPDDLMLRQDIEKGIDMAKIALMRT